MDGECVGESASRLGSEFLCSTVPNMWLVLVGGSTLFVCVCKVNHTTAIIIDPSYAR